MIDSQKLGPHRSNGT